jgi:hypothetical protein
VLYCSPVSFLCLEFEENRKQKREEKKALKKETADADAARLDEVTAAASVLVGASS